MLPHDPEVKALVLWHRWTRFEARLQRDLDKSWWLPADRRARWNAQRAMARIRAADYQEQYMKNCLLSVVGQRKFLVSMGGDQKVRDFLAKVGE